MMVQRWSQNLLDMRKMTNNPDGIYVFYTDYADLERQRDELAERNKELNRVVSIHLAVATDDPILQTDLERAVWKLRDEKRELAEQVATLKRVVEARARIIKRLESENTKLKDSLKATLESHNKTVSDLMTEYTKVIDGLKKGGE